MKAWHVATFCCLLLGLGCSGGDSPPAAPKPKPVALAAGSLHHTCALLSDGTAKCWGANDRNQLGAGTPALASFSSLPVGIPGLTSAVALTAGDDHTCALLLNSTVQCWGSNHTGQLGIGTVTAASLLPVAVSGLTSVTAITASAVHTCALLLDSTVRCWGSNIFAQLGIGTVTGPESCQLLSDSAIRPCSTTPVPVTGLTSVTAVTAGGAHTCALLADRTMKCWGSNFWGELGIGTVTGPQVCFGTVPCSPTPVLVSGLPSALGLAAWFDGTCALLLNSTVQCWGLNADGNLGTGRTPLSSPPLYLSSLPLPVADLTSVVTLTAGVEHFCAIVTDQTVRCWGSNETGQLGLAVTASLSSLPIPVPGLASVSALAAGYRHTCALLPDRTVQCWGLNDIGQLGIGTVTGPELCSLAFVGTFSCSTRPVTVSGF